MAITSIITMTETPKAYMKRAVVAPLARFNEAQIGRPEDYRHRGLPGTLGLAVWKGEDHGPSRHRHVHGGREREHIDNHDPCRSPSQRLYACQSPSLFTDAILFSPAGPLSELANRFHTCTGPPNPSLDFSWPRFSPGLACRARPKSERSVGNER